MFDTKYGSPWE